MSANKGKASRAVVQALINDMNDFSEYVNGELQAMLNQAERLGESWKDPQYSQFSSFISELTESLKKDLTVFREATIALQKKLDMYQ